MDGDVENSFMMPFVQIEDDGKIHSFCDIWKIVSGSNGNGVIYLNEDTKLMNSVLLMMRGIVEDTRSNKHKWKSMKSWVEFLKGVSSSKYFIIYKDIACMSGSGGFAYSDDNETWTRKIFVRS